LSNYKITKSIFKNIITIKIMTKMTTVIQCIPIAIGIMAVSTTYYITGVRNIAHDHIYNIEDMSKRYETEYQHNMSKCNEQNGECDIVKERHEKDRAWKEREIARQKEWLNRPFYRQFGSVPFPRYGDY